LIRDHKNIKEYGLILSTRANMRLQKVSLY